MSLTAKQIVSYCLADDFDNDLLDSLVSGLALSAKIKESWVLTRDEGEFFIFTYGVVVVWQKDGREPDLSWLKPCLIRPEPEVEKDLFEFVEGDRFRIHMDLVTLDNKEQLSRLAISHALAQSSKLAVFESRARKLISQTQQIAADLARDGHISLNRSSLAKWQGKIHLSKSDILLRFDLLDTPEFFWEYPEYQEYYQKMLTYLELEQRLIVIQSKLNTVNDVLALVGEELRHQHSSVLEWIIILLIAFEIFVFIVHDWLALI